MKALSTNAAQALLYDQLTKAPEKGVADGVNGLIPSGFLFIQNGVIDTFGSVSGHKESLANETLFFDRIYKIFSPVLTNINEYHLSTKMSRLIRLSP